MRRGLALRQALGLGLRRPRQGRKQEQLLPLKRALQFRGRLDLALALGQVLPCMQAPMQRELSPSPGQLEWQLAWQLEWRLEWQAVHLRAPDPVRPGSARLLELERQCHRASWQDSMPRTA